MATIPFSARASGGAVTVRGGGKLRKFVSDFRGLSNEKVAAIIATILRREMLPELKRRAPKRTGALQRSLKIVRRGSSVELRGIFYGRFVALRDAPGLTIARLALTILEEKRSRIRTLLADAIRRELGI